VHGIAAIRAGKVAPAVNEDDVSGARLRRLNVSGGLGTIVPRLDSRRLSRRGWVGHAKALPARSTGGKTGARRSSARYRSVLTARRDRVSAEDF